MKNYTTNATPRYFIQSEKGDHFNIFKRRENAIKACINLAFEFPGNTFIVVKKVYSKNKNIFSFNLTSQFDLTDIKLVYSGIMEASQSKLEKTRFWRKAEEDKHEG
jgi:hypothetical protein